MKKKRKKEKICLEKKSKMKIETKEIKLST